MWRTQPESFTTGSRKSLSPRRVRRGSEQHPWFEVQPGGWCFHGRARLSTRSPMRRMMCWMQGVIVARSSRATGYPSAASWLATSVGLSGWECSALAKGDRVDSRIRSSYFDRREVRIRSTVSAALQRCKGGDGDRRDKSCIKTEHRTPHR